MTSRAHILFKKASAVHQKQAARPLGATESIVTLYNGVFCVGVFNISRTKQQKQEEKPKKHLYWHVALARSYYDARDGVWR